MCTASIAKCFLIVFNTIFFLLGAAVLGIGVFVLVDQNTILSVFSRIPGAEETVTQALNATSILEKSSYMLLAGGGLVFVIGFLGCCGACCKNKCMLYLYAIFVFLILSIEIAGGALGYFYKDQVDTRMTAFLKDTIAERYEGSVYIGNNGPSIGSKETVTLAWDTAMVQLSCCGATSHTDFKDMATKWNRTYQYVTVGGSPQVITAVVPPTCCKITDKSKFPADIAGLEFTNLVTCVKDASDDSTNKQNCRDKLEELFYQYMYYIIGVGIGVGVIEIVSVVAACVLIRSMNKEENEVSTMKN